MWKSILRHWKAFSICCLLLLLVGPSFRGFPYSVDTAHAAGHTTLKLIKSYSGSAFRAADGYLKTPLKVANRVPVNVSVSDVVMAAIPVAGQVTIAKAALSIACNVGLPLALAWVLSHTDWLMVNGVPSLHSASGLVPKPGALGVGNPSPILYSGEWKYFKAYAESSNVATICKDTYDDGWPCAGADSLLTGIGYDTSKWGASVTTKPGKAGYLIYPKIANQLVQGYVDTPLSDTALNNALTSELTANSPAASAYVTDVVKAIEPDVNHFCDYGTVPADSLIAPASMPGVVDTMLDAVTPADETDLLARDDPSTAPEVDPDTNKVEIEGPLDVNVINQPTVHLAGEEGWASAVESGGALPPDGYVAPDQVPDSSQFGSSKEDFGSRWSTMYDSVVDALTISPVSLDVTGRVSNLCINYWREDIQCVDLAQWDDSLNVIGTWMLWTIPFMMLAIIFF